MPTDERFAKLVGAILYDTGHGSDRMAVVLASDPDDIVALATAVPGTRIVTRDPAAPL